MGNKLDLINKMRDIHQPGGLPFWPPAPGWWILAFITLCAIAWLLIRRHKSLALRREAEKERLRLKSKYQGDKDGRALAMGLSTLLRRLALSCDARRNVAGLTGDDWLRYLDFKGKTSNFSNGPGRELTAAPYGDASGLDAQALLKLVERWIHQNS